MSQLWLITLKTAGAKRKFLDVQQQLVKEKYFIVDPNRAEARLKVRWASPLVPDHRSAKPSKALGSFKT